MNALYLTLYVSLLLVIAAGILFGFLYTRRSHEYADRLSLLPLDSDEEIKVSPSPSRTKERRS